MNISDYKSFLLKYQKTNYISSKDQKKLDVIGLDFERLLNKVSNCFNFFDKQNFEILNDLLLYVTDDFDYCMDFKIEKLILTSNSYLYGVTSYHDLENEFVVIHNMLNNIIDWETNNNNKINNIILNPCIKVTINTNNRLIFNEIMDGDDYFNKKKNTFTKDVDIRRLS